MHRSYKIDGDRGIRKTNPTTQLTPAQTSARSSRLEKLLIRFDSLNRGDCPDHGLVQHGCKWCQTVPDGLRIVAGNGCVDRLDAHAREVGGVGRVALVAPGLGRKPFPGRCP